MLAPKLREIVVQILFALDSGGDAGVIDLVMSEAKIAKTHAKEAFAVAERVRDNLEVFDQRIDAATKDYELERIPAVEKNIFRYALYEIEEGNDPPLVIKEAIRLARKFSTPEAGAFVHAVLHTLTSLPPQAGSDLS